MYRNPGRPKIADPKRVFACQLRLSLQTWLREQAIKMQTTNNALIERAVVLLQAEVSEKGQQALESDKEARQRVGRMQLKAAEFLSERKPDDDFTPL